MADEETNDDVEARRRREFNEAMREAREISPEEWEATKERIREKEEEQDRSIFGDKKPTAWVDKYIEP
ncbi:hypothetical protein ND748_15570 [Frankia sp. AiPs1]|uniref:hypothetical protein n=1 Tax=Frankia sp. AiPs1 TaxID=573493 RepID=UPI00204463D1|nr:hypothetical protein [Frankia sp. AiPs1]MCM3923076.1 hypothetical protein [Frankia sp. AiPs1]